MLQLLGSYVCTEPSCRTKTRQLLVEGRCVNGACKGRVVADQFTERVTNDTLRYLQGLFDVTKYRAETNETNIDKLRDLPYEDSYKAIKKVIDEVTSHSSYNKVDLGALFSFMLK